jgi:hypothetical protein
VEILGDLKKRLDVEESRKEVEMLANKIVPACSTVNADFRFLIRGELAGHRVEMSGVPAISGARQLSDEEGKKGFIFEESAEHKALLRWQIRDFNGAEMLLAEAWKFSTQSLDLEDMQRKLKDAYSGKLNLRNLAETGRFVDELVQTAPPAQLLTWFFRDACVSLRGHEIQRIESLRNASSGTFGSILPYTAYCLRTALIFHFGLAFGLVSTRATCRLDLEYFYYAPFCHVFSSSDNFHRKMASLILREQMFVSGDVLKADLGKLAIQRKASEPAQQDDAAQQYGPPENEESVTHQAWMKTMKPGFKDVAKDIANNLTPEVSAKMLKKYQQLMKTKTQSQPVSISMDDCEFMIIEHTVRADGPCICGGSKMFKDCCGQKMVAEKRRGPQPSV